MLRIRVACNEISLKNETARRADLVRGSVRLEIPEGLESRTCLFWSPERFDLIFVVIPFSKSRCWYFGVVEFVYGDNAMLFSLALADSCFLVVEEALLDS
jgi:hypothetical protein